MIKKLLFFCLMISTLFSCSMMKKQTDIKEIPKDYTLVRVIDANNKNCGFLLENDATDKLFRPQNLQEKYHQNNQKIYIKFRPIKPLDRTCSIGMPIYIEDVILP